MRKGSEGFRKLRRKEYSPRGNRQQMLRPGGWTASAGSEEGSQGGEGWQKPGLAASVMYR